MNRHGGAYEQVSKRYFLTESGCGNMIISLRKIGALIRLVFFFVIITLLCVQLYTWFFNWLSPLYRPADLKGGSISVLSPGQVRSDSASFDPITRLKWFYLTGE